MVFHEIPFRLCERIFRDFCQVFCPEFLVDLMRCIVLRFLVGLTLGFLVWLFRRPWAMLSVWLFLIVPSGRLSVGTAYAATSPTRAACSRAGEVLARNCCACSRRTARKTPALPRPRWGEFHFNLDGISKLYFPRRASSWSGSVVSKCFHRKASSSLIRRGWRSELSTHAYASTRVASSRPGKVLARDCCARSRRFALNCSLASLRTRRYIARLGLTYRMVWARCGPLACSQMYGRISAFPERSFARGVPRLCV